MQIWIDGIKIFKIFYAVVSNWRYYSFDVIKIVGRVGLRCLENTKSKIEKNYHQNINERKTESFSLKNHIIICSFNLRSWQKYIIFTGVWFEKNQGSLFSQG